MTAKTMREMRKAVVKFLGATGHDLCHTNRLELAEAFGLENMMARAPKTVEEFDAG